MTELEQKMLEIYQRELRHYLKLSMDRDILEKSQAAFRLGVSENRIESDYLATGKIKMILEDGKLKYSGISIRQYVEANHFSFKGTPEQWPDFKRMILADPELIKAKKVG
jgi:hypothetical protein